MEKFYGCVRELSLNCDLGSHKESILRDVFTANMQDGEIQRELLKETKMAKKSLKLAINFEMGIQNQLKILGTDAYTVLNQVANTYINCIQNSWNRSKSTTINFKRTMCPNCGYAWSASHSQNCPARGNKCKYCGITNRFAKVCRKSKIQVKPKPSVNNVDDASWHILAKTATIGTFPTVEEQVNQIDAMMQKHSIYDANYDSDYDYFEDNCVTIVSDSDSIREAEPVSMLIQIGNTETNALVDSGSVCTVIRKSIAIAVVLDINESYWVQTPQFQDLKIFSKELNKTIGVINTTVRCKDWIVTNVNVTVVEDGHRPIIDRNLFPQFGFSLMQSKQVLNITQNQCLIKKQIALDFPYFISRIGKSLKHTYKSTFHNLFTPTHQRRRRVLINLQPLVNAELKKNNN